MADLTLLTKTDVVDNVTSSDTNKPLSANQGVVLKTLVDGKQDADATILKQADVVDNVTSSVTNKPLSANQGKVLAGKLTDGSVTKVGTATVGGTLKPMYLNSGTPTAGTQLYNKNININGSNKSIIRSTDADIGTIYAPTSAGSSGQYLRSSGGTPSWNSFSLGSWTNVAFSGSSGVVLAPASGYSFSIGSGNNCKYRQDTLGRIEVSLRMTITTSNSIPANSFALVGTCNKTNGGVDVWVMSTLNVSNKYYSVPLHINGSGNIYLSNTTSSAISMSNSELQVTFFTS